MGRKAKRPTRTRTSDDSASSSSLADALFPRTKQRVLALLFGQPDRRFGTMELIGLAESGSGAVQRELDRLVASGLVTATSAGRSKYYQANRAAPIFAELYSIVEKTGGIADVLRACLAPLAPRIRLAVLYGSIAKESDRATSDVDVLLVGDDLTLEDVFAALQPAEQRLGRRVSPTVYTGDEFDRRRRTGHPFLTRVLAGKHIVLIGREDAVPSA